MQKIYIFLAGIVLGAALCFGTVWYFIVQPSQRTIEDYRAKQLVLEDINSKLGKSVTDREADIVRLTAVSDGLRRENSRAREDYRKLDEANRVRQGIIEGARGAVEGTDDALRKLELIIDAFEAVELSLRH